MLRQFVCLLAMSSALLLAACQTPASGEAEGNEGPNAFSVVIDATRLGVIIEHASEGAQSVDGPEESNTLRADAELKDAAAKLIALRNAVCRRHLVPASKCGLGAMPAWTLEAPDGAATLAELTHRMEWLNAKMDLYVDAGCKAGVKTSGEELYCSVE